ncbi:M20/M25/M40 family metallo-hydrolase [Motilibacter aurantiacus]|uniref:M20/M25/M40 family metallo-hydrolase n=1 Tax=Motilibacter aurantiacus TaxID=2714955 RepID=UPI0014090BE4|nr:M20/M25/M40 family metallo-hydrolase [Motilibacter aurantiacus]NHC44958.1 M20/M25/M40 family metallo-hydrolase [Motilibacter aurantiacus]
MRRRSDRMRNAVLAAATAVAACVAAVPLGASAQAAPPVAQVPAGHGIADLIVLVNQLRAEGRIGVNATTSLLDRAQRALREEQGGSEARPIALLRHFLARAENQVRDLGARAELVAAAQRSIAWLEEDDYAELTGSAQLQQDVTLAGLLRHLQAFQEIADANGGNRFAGYPGHEDSAEYVYNLLDAAGYDVSYQHFPYSIADSTFQQVAPDPVAYTPVAQYNPATNTGYGDVTGRVVPVDVNNNPGPIPSSNTSGCEESDFAAFPAGAVALLQRGTCDFVVKAANAQAAGAAAAIIYNEGTTGVADRNNTLNPTVAGREIRIPVVGVSYLLGRDLMEPATTTVRVRTEVVGLTTRNVIAETPGGDADNVVMLGGHLDSVDEGPGVNDNGTGTAALLETALQLAGDPVNNKVRFAFWSAEESGLLGSNYYVNSLPVADRQRIALYLNFDMVGSPNYYRGVYDGSGSLGGTAPRPPGSAQIEQLFNTHFGFRGLPYEDTEFNGRSDYQAFINNGIPSGGLFTGAEGDKSAAQVERYGGVVADYDPCYHQACDSLTPTADGADAALYAQLAAAYGSQLVGNVNTYALDTSADAIAHAAATYAYSTETVNGGE